MRALLILLAMPLGAQQFLLHAFHKEMLGGTLDCGLCHVAEEAGSVTLKRPGHQQCMVCHGDAFGSQADRKICGQCHDASARDGAANLLPFPPHKGTGAILNDFSHTLHVDPKARIDAQTGFRADCTFCHKFDSEARFATLAGHRECATCHSKAGMKPPLTAGLKPGQCRACHNPEKTETTALAPLRSYVDIAFSHGAHFKVREQFGLRCTTCHYATLMSTSVASLSLPMMIDCVQCHDSARAVKAEFRISNCKLCHRDKETPAAIPTSHTVNVKPEFHTEVFRMKHAAEASSPDAKCFVCHQNVAPSMSAKMKCDSCHAVMRPKSHTARWKYHLHGKYAALDRTVFATCHTASYCSDCHNELPRSHNPLPLFKAGGHASAAKVDLRTGFTCHSYNNTCSTCHLNQIAH
jgi:hypothetical protein